MQSFAGFYLQISPSSPVSFGTNVAHHSVIINGSKESTGGGFSVQRGVAIISFLVSWLGFVPVATSDEFVPHAHQLDFTLDNFSGFVASTSQVHVREEQLNGTRFHLVSALGIRRMDIPRIVLTYWFDELNAIQVNFRYFDAAGSHRLNQPATFNGTTLIPNQRLSPRGTLWLDGAVYYERRLTPWLQLHLGKEFLLNHLDLRVKLGLEFTYIDFRLNNGTAQVTSASPKGETSEDFFLQELPMPTIGMESYAKISEHVRLEASLKVNWINRWNSLRDEGGTVYTSQLGFETHWRLYYVDFPYLDALHPFVGLGYLYYRQNEQSHEDGNFIRLSVVGPEFGVTYTF
jgi:hypothetical protein